MGANHGRDRDWYEAQDDEWQGQLDAFAEGIKAYAREHSDRIADEAEVVLPLDGTDILAHSKRVILFYFVTSPQVPLLAEAQWSPEATASPASNAWVIGPSGHRAPPTATVCFSETRTRPGRISTCSTKPTWYPGE